MESPLLRSRRKRAVGLVRVSDVGDRDKEGGHFVSPDDQRRIIDNICQQHDLELVASFEELNKSGYSRSLARRPGLRQAIEMIEASTADIIVVGFFDRLFRKISVKIEAFQRIQKAGGEFITGDLGKLETDTAAQRLNLNVMIAIAEFQAEQTADKTAGPKVAAINAGIPTFPNIPLGYRKDPQTRRLVIDEDDAPVVREMFKLRAAGTSIKDLHRWLRAQGYDKSWRAVQHMLGSRIYLGELNFGKLCNPHAHPAIIDPGTFRTIKNMRVSRKRKELSVRLLARQGIVLCAQCGSRMTVGGQTHWKDKRYFDYRCPPIGTCASRSVISATLLEDTVVEYMKQITGSGHASSDNALNEAQASLDAVGQEITDLVSAFAGFGSVAAVQARMSELTTRQEAARERVESLRVGLGPAVTLSMVDWDDLTLHEQRALIRAVIQRILISRGRGPDRVKIEPFPTQPLG